MAKEKGNTTRKAKRTSLEVELNAVECSTSEHQKIKNEVYILIKELILSAHRRGRKKKNFDPGEFHAA